MKLVLANQKGDIFVHPTLEAMGASGGEICRPERKAWVRFPEGSVFFYMPGHIGFGWDEGLRVSVGVKALGGEDVFPVAAFPVSGFTRTYLPAAQKTDPLITLPLWPYTSVGWERGKFYVAALQVDRSRRQRPSRYRRLALMEKNIERTARELTGNRLLRHLMRCARLYNCRNAQDFFLHRWEAPLPVSPSCNAHCVGCLSYQAEGCEASQCRIDFVPGPQEVADIALLHIRRARNPIVSFGQGCEGEPLLQFDVIKEAIRRVRRRTQAGTIHMNTNGFCASYLKELATEGLDSVRISVNSLDPERYRAYYRPKNYTLRDVVRSFKTAKQNGLFVSMNLLVFPGVTDTAPETKRMVAFLKKGAVDLLQLRNLSMDPGFFLERVPRSCVSGALGILRFVSLVKKECPRLRLGYFNLSKERFLVI